MTFGFAWKHWHLKNILHYKSMMLFCTFISIWVCLLNLFKSCYIQIDQIKLTNRSMNFPFFSILIMEFIYHRFFVHVNATWCEKTLICIFSFTKISWLYLFRKTYLTPIVIWFFWIDHFTRLFALSLLIVEISGPFLNLLVF